MQLPGQIVEEKKQNNNMRWMRFPSRLLFLVVFFARTRATLEISGVVVLVPHVRREKKTTTN